MRHVLNPMSRRSLADDLAQRVRELIQTGGYEPGDRLPSIAEMAQRFGVAHPTLREALRKLETLGMLSIRHGSGVYVQQQEESLLLQNPRFAVTREVLLDLVEARIVIELKTAALAAEHASADQLTELREVLERSWRSLGDDSVMADVNIAFHRGIAEASGNPILCQLLTILTVLIQPEQRVMLDTPACRQRFRREHDGILEALEQREPALVVERMRAHLEGVLELLRGPGPNGTN